MPSPIWVLITMGGYIHRVLTADSIAQSTETDSPTQLKATSVTLSTIAFSTALFATVTTCVGRRVENNLEDHPSA